VADDKMVISDRQRRRGHSGCRRCSWMRIRSRWAGGSRAGRRWVEEMAVPDTGWPASLGSWSCAAAREVRVLHGVSPCSGE
jgi:hypothetical protein